MSSNEQIVWYRVHGLSSRLIMQAWSHLNKYKGYMNYIQIKQVYDKYLKRKQNNNNNDYLGLYNQIFIS